MDAKEIAEEILCGTVTMKSATDVAKAYLDLLEQNRWIPVEERLPNYDPENPVEYDVITSKGLRITDVMFDPEEESFAEMILDFEDDFDHWRYLKGVTHWRPLPPLPDNRVDV